MKKNNFRGKRVDNGEFVKGYFIEDTEFCGKPHNHSYIVDHKHPSGCFGGDIYKEVIPQTVGQFTGKKDLNRVEIYEADIVEIPDHANGEVIRGVVLYDDETARYIVHCKNYGVGYDLGDFYEREIEVIGNIYDNAELLEVTE